MFDALITTVSVTTGDDTLLCNSFPSLAAPPSPAQHLSQLPEPSAQAAVTATRPAHGPWHPRRRRFTSRPGAPSIQAPK